MVFDVAQISAAPSTATVAALLNTVDRVVKPVGANAAIVLVVVVLSSRAQPVLPTIMISARLALGTPFHTQRTKAIPGVLAMHDPAYYQTIEQYGSNNIIAIDNTLLNGEGRTKFCGKKVIVEKDGVRVSAPDGGDFFVWDGCQACIGGGKIDFSVSGARQIDANACMRGVIPGVKYTIYGEQVKPFIP